MNNAIDYNSDAVSAFDVDGFFFYKKAVSSAALQAGGAVASLNKELAKGTVKDIRTLLSHLKAAGAAQGKSQAWDSLVRQAKRVCRSRGWKLSTTKGFPVVPIDKASDSDNFEFAEFGKTGKTAPTFNQVLSLVLSLTEDEQGQILGEVAKSLDLDIDKIKEKSGSIKRPTLVAAIKASAKDHGPASLDQVA